MGKWYHTIKLGRYFTDDSVDWKVRAKYAIDTIRGMRSKLPVEDGCGIDDPDEELNWILDDLENALAIGDIDAFDEEWHRLYSWADNNRVWVDTFSDPND